MAFIDPILLLLFFAAILASFIDAAAGGGGLITIPVLMLTGISPLQALATNKLQGSFGSFFASLHFFNSGYIDLKRIPFMVFCVAIGSISGCFIAIFIGNDSLRFLLPFVLSNLAIYLLFSKNIGISENNAIISDRRYAVTAGLGIGAYDGFLGPGTGSFFALSLIKLLGVDYVKATAYAKILNFSGNLIALLVFLFAGHIVFLYGIVMGLGQIIGATLGSRIAIAKGVKFIKAITVIMCIALSIKIVITHFF